MSVIIKSLMDQYEAFNVLFLPFSLKVCSQRMKMQLRHHLFLAFGSQEERFPGRVTVYTGWLSWSEAREPKFQQFYGTLSFRGISDCWADVLDNLMRVLRHCPCLNVQFSLRGKAQTKKGVFQGTSGVCWPVINNRIGEAGIALIGSVCWFLRWKYSH